MRPGCVTVLFPCHTLDDFPTWLEEPEADGLLAAWTAAWHPAVVAATGGPPGWASVDLPPPGDIAAGVVPGFCDDRFVAQSDPDHARRWVRQLASCVEITAALAAAVGVSGSEGGPLPASGWAEDFRALGLATLLAELLARLEAEKNGRFFGGAWVYHPEPMKLMLEDMLVEAG
jgi:alpha-mannosidase